MIKVYVEGSSFYGKMIEDSIIISDPIKADLIIFTGGADVNPKLYSETCHNTTRFSDERDDKDKAIYTLAIKNNIPMLGICRGAQFLTVMNGGKLIQHVEGHANGDHNASLHDPSAIGIEGEVFNTTSTHHQMMYPFNLDPSSYDILASSEEELSSIYHKNKTEVFKEEEIDVECEIVYYKETLCLCIQGHPESMLTDEVMMTIVNNMVDVYLFLHPFMDGSEDTLLLEEAKKKESVEKLFLSQEEETGELENFL